MHAGLMALSIGAIALGAVLLFIGVGGILRVLRESEVLRTPASAEQSITLQQSGSYVLNVSQPRLGTFLQRTGFSVRDGAGREVPSSASIVRTQVSGFSTAQISVRNFEIAQPGSYRLIVSGIDPGMDLSRVELVITRPFGLALFARILCTVAGGVALIGGIVFTALQKAGKL